MLSTFQNAEVQDIRCHNLNPTFIPFLYTLHNSVDIPTF